MKNKIAKDKKAREKAVESDKSFIVKAPAGSGKTDLLIARYLKLLYLVDSPEEIIAVTFTNKATNEMRRKILNILDNARLKKRPENEHEKYLISLANDVLERDKEKKWCLDDSPDRLRVQTIDGLCSFLTRRMPLLIENDTETSKGIRLRSLMSLLASLSEIALTLPESFFPSASNAV